MVSPMADHKEYLPPTQSQNPNMLLVSMPNSATLAALVDKATKCFATAFSSPAFSRNQVLAVVALVMVSCVVNVLEAMTKRVLSGSHFLRASAMWVPSMLETKWTLGPTQNGFKAS